VYEPEESIDTEVEDSIDETEDPTTEEEQEDEGGERSDLSEESEEETTPSTENECQLCHVTLSTKWVYSWYDDMIKCNDCMQKYIQDRKLTFANTISRQKMFLTIKRKTSSSPNKSKNKSDDISKSDD
jgi:hypothetical protein